jgi:hypothetical protein
MPRRVVPNLKGRSHLTFPKKGGSLISRRRKAPMDTQITTMELVMTRLVMMMTEKYLEAMMMTMFLRERVLMGRKPVSLWMMMMMMMMTPRRARVKRERR